MSRYGGCGRLLVRAEVAGAWLLAVLIGSVEQARTAAAPSGDSDEEAPQVELLAPLQPGDDLLERLRPQQAPPNPLRQVAHLMGAVRGELGRRQTGHPTQERQGEIVRRLDELIEQLEKECEACRGAGRGSVNPSRPLDDSRIVGGPGGSGELHAPRNRAERWGELPPRERERILQSLTEGFPPHYQPILERYYRRLAEGSAADEAARSPAANADDSAGRDTRPARP